jgi:hypothetical protein
VAGVKSVAADYLQWCRHHRIFERAEMTPALSRQLTPGFREMLEPKKHEDGSVHYVITNLSFMHQPEPPAPGMPPPKMSIDDKTKNALFGRLCRREWMQCYARVEGAIKEAVEELASERKGGEPLSVSFDWDKHPVPGTLLWFAMSRAGDGMIAKWAAEDEAAAKAEQDRLLRNKREDGRSKHKSWVMRKDSTRVVLPPRSEWTAAKLERVAAKHGVSLGAARALLAGKRGDEALSNSVLLALEGLDIVVEGSHAVHAPHDLVESRKTLEDSMFVYQQNFRDLEDGTLDDECRARFEGAKSRREADGPGQYRRRRQEAAKEAFVGWMSKKEQVRRALEALSFVPLAPDMVSPAEAIAKHLMDQEAASGSKAFERQLLDRCVDELGLTKLESVVRHEMGALGPCVLPDGRFLPLREIRVSDVERWRAVGACLRAIGANDLLTPWTQWSAPLFSSSECASLWNVLGPPPMLSEADDMTVEDAARALQVLETIAQEHRGELGSTIDRFVGRAPLAPLCFKLDTDVTSVRPPPGEGSDGEAIHVFAMVPPAKGGGWVSLQWEPAKSESRGEAPSFFVVETCGRVGSADSLSGRWSSVCVDPPCPPSMDATITGPKFQCIVEGLSPGDAYLFRVRSVNAFGVSPFTVLRVAVQPAIPFLPSASHRASRSLTIEWSEQRFSQEMWKRLHEVFVCGGSTLAARDVRAAIETDSSLFQFLQGQSTAGGGSVWDVIKEREDPLTWEDLSPSQAATSRPSTPAAASTMLRASLDSTLHHLSRPGSSSRMRHSMTTSPKAPRVSSLVYELWSLDLGDPDSASTMGGEAAPHGWPGIVGEGIISPGGPGWKKLFSGKATKYLMTDIRPASPYLFAVRCSNDEGNWSPFSPVGVIRTRLPCPQRVICLMPVAHSSLKLSWLPVLPGQEGGAAAAVASTLKPSAVRSKGLADDWALGRDRVSGGQAADRRLASSLFEHQPTEKGAFETVTHDDDDGDDDTASIRSDGSDAGPSPSAKRSTSQDKPLDWVTRMLLCRQLGIPAAVSEELVSTGAHGWLERAEEIEYQVEHREADACTSSSWASQRTEQTTVELVGLRPNTQYQVRVRTRAGPGASAWSTPVTVATAPLEPFAPAVVRSTGNTVTLRWHAAEGGASGYTVLAATVGNLARIAPRESSVAELLDQQDLEWTPVLRTRTTVAVSRGCRSCSW